jgi:hypothetical protein
MNGVGDQFLAGAGLAADQHRGVPLGHLADQLEDAPHALGVADDLLEAVLLAHLPAQGVALVRQPPALALGVAQQAHPLGQQVGHHLQ